MSFAQLEVATFTPSSISKARVNEHLAVLMPKSLWKPDSSAVTCDNFFCRLRFTLLERRHHCRKCGGVFCRSCTARTTPLLDTSSLDFVHPPPNAPINSYGALVCDARVCDDCFDQVHGSPSSSPPTPELVYGPSRASSPSPPSIMSTHSNMSSSSSSSSSSPSVQLHLNAEPSFGALDAYPLKRSSVLCKATGGGRWEPKPCQEALTRIDDLLRRKEAKQRKRKDNPVICDGSIQYRFPRDPEPEQTNRISCFSTF